MSVSLLNEARNVFMSSRVEFLFLDFNVPAIFFVVAIVASFDDVVFALRLCWLALFSSVLSTKLSVVVVCVLVVVLLVMVAGVVGIVVNVDAFFLKSCSLADFEEKFWQNSRNCQYQQVKFCVKLEPC